MVMDILPERASVGARPEQEGAALPSPRRSLQTWRPKSDHENVDDLVGIRLDDHDAIAGKHEVAVRAIGREDLDDPRRKRMQLDRFGDCDADIPAEARLDRLDLVLHDDVSNFGLLLGGDIDAARDLVRGAG
jgi:hypothetical protein